MTPRYPGLADYPQFIRYIVRPSRNRPGKTDKFPIHPTTGAVSNAHDPDIWLIHDQALSSGLGEGVGFVFTEQDPFFFLDVDGAYDGVAWSPKATELCAMFPGCFIEVSHSGTGLHIIGSAPDAPLHGTRCNEYGLELYTKGRFVALTGSGASGSAAVDASVALAGLVGQHFPPTAATSAPEEWTDGPCAEWSGPASDSDLIAKMRASKPSAGAAFGGKATLLELLDGSTDAYAGDASAADQALCNHLAFWTGKDCGRIDRIFRTTGLMRDKWEQRSDYRQWTIIGAVSQCQNVYSGGKPKDPSPPDPETGLRDGYQFMSIVNQIPFFEGCVYLDALSEIWCPDGQTRDAKRFKVYRGGFDFSLNHDGSKSTRDAWEAFTLSMGYNFPKVDTVCFRPENPSGAIVEEEGFKLLNTYFPIITRRVQGDPAPFTDLISRLLPDIRDQQILISYLAAVIQYPGVKFQWWPVIQGTKGNGKTAIMQCMAHSVGSRYSHLPNADAMVRDGNKFNSWMNGKLFIGLEELAAGNQREFLEAFKTTITNKRIQIEGKGVNQIMGDNRANGLICTNHRDGAPADKDERRYAIFFTAQQSKDDLKRDGMDGEYFPRLYRWLDADGYSIVNDFLHTYQIAAEFNPAGSCHRAPDTSSTAAALMASKGGIEQAIEEAVEEGRLGFCGGWISGFALDQLLEERRMGGKIPHQKRADILLTLGYIPHPHLKNGRVNNSMTDPGSGKTGKPRLFLREGHLAGNVTLVAEIVRRYELAQGEAGTLAAVAFSA